MVGRLLYAVAFPALSKVAREEQHRLPVALARIRLHLLAIVLPLFVVLSLASNFIIDTLYDQRYAAAGTYLAITALSSAVVVLPMFYQNAFLALGNSRVHFFVMCATAIFRIGGLLSGFYFAGIEGMLVGIGVGSLLGFFVSAGFARSAGWQSLLVDAFLIGVIFVGVASSFAWHTLR